MIVCLNGQFLPAEEARVSIFDRGFLYGDGLFETLRLYGGRPFRWDQHVARLTAGAQWLRLSLPVPPPLLRAWARELIRRNQATDAVLRLTLTRGVAPPGYSLPDAAPQPCLAMSLHPAPRLSAARPPRWRLVTSSLRLPPGDTLGRFKTCNKLPQILARAEAQAAGADEALLLNTTGEVVEAAASNVFWIHDNVVATPPLASGALAGVTRAVVRELCDELRLPVREQATRPDALRQAAGVFLTVSTWGLIEASALDGQALGRSPLVARLRSAYRAAVARECGKGWPES